MDLRIFRYMPTEHQWDYWYTSAADTPPVLLSASHDVVAVVNGPTSRPMFALLHEHAARLGATNIEMLFGNKQHSIPSMLGVRFSGKINSKKWINQQQSMLDFVVTHTIIEMFAQDEVEVHNVAIVGCTEPFGDEVDPRNPTPRKLLLTLQNWLMSE
jgi:hypothetical protein